MQKVLVILSFFVVCAFLNLVICEITKFFVIEVDAYNAFTLVPFGARGVPEVLGATPDSVIVSVIGVVTLGRT